MVNSYGPDGSVTYAADPNAPGGYAQTTSLSPGQQQLYDAGLKTQIGAVNLAQGQLGRVENALANSPGMQTSVAPTSGNVQYGVAPTTGGIQYSFDAGGPIQNSVATGNALQTGYDAGGNIQTGIGPTDFSADRQAVTDSVWNQAISRLDPYYGRQQNALDTRLANQGIGMNSQAYGNAQDVLGRNRNDAYNQALFSAVQQGANEQNTLFNQALNQGQFANQAQQQQNTQNANQAAFYNQSALSEFERAMNQGLFANQSQQQQYDQNAGLAQFNNQAQNQNFTQNLAQQQANNAAQQQQYGQNLNSAQFANDASAYNQNLPINQLTALLGLGQVSSPQGINYSPTSVANTDVLGSYALNQQQQNANYQAKMANQGGLLGGLFKLGSTALGGILG